MNRIELIFERSRLISRLRRWRVAASLFAIMLVALVVMQDSSDNIIATDYIAKLNVEDIIVEDPERYQAVVNLASSKNKAKALMVYINSPGGTIYGSEMLYHAIKKVAHIKPVVVVMGTYAASGGYMAALPAHRIFAGQSTMTGSIGVVFQVPNFKELSDKVGVKMIEFRSSVYKAAPSMYQDMSAKVKDEVNQQVDESFNFFKTLVKIERKLTDQELLKVANGKVFSGDTALRLKLVDQIGFEDEALDWLKDTHNISSKLPVRNIFVTKDNFINELSKGLEKVLLRVTAPRLF